MSVNGKPVVQERLKRTIPLQISRGEGLDVGSPVDFNYELPFQFTDGINTVTIALE